MYIKKKLVFAFERVEFIRLQCILLENKDWKSLKYN